MKSKEQNVTPKELGQIRALIDFDLVMLISEIHDHGWPQARKLIPFILEAQAVHGDYRTGVRGA